MAAGGVAVGGTAFLAATDGAASVGGTFRFSALEAAATTVFGAVFSAAGTGSFSPTTAGDIFFFFAFCKYGVKNRDEH